MAKAILSQCLHCNVQFKQPASKQAKFCGKACYWAHGRPDGPKHKDSTPFAPCSHCGKTVFSLNGKKRDGSAADNRFCDRVCYDAYKAAIKASKKHSCECCGETFIHNAKVKKYCSMECRLNGMKADPKHCINCGCFFSPLVLSSSTGKFVSVSNNKTCSRECNLEWFRNDEERKVKIGLAFAGSKHPNWQGGKSQINSIGHRGPDWQKQRKAALKKCGYKCIDCGLTDLESMEKYGSSLDVDHVTPFHNFNNYKEANRVSNLECRCKSCHKIAESKRGMVQMVLTLSDHRRGHHNPRDIGANAKLTKADVIRIRTMAKSGGVLRTIHESFSQVGLDAIRMVIKGQTWRNV